MAKLIFGLQQSLDGYVDHLEMRPRPALFRHFRPFVLGHGTPFFAGPRPPLRLVASDRIGEDTIRLTYVPA
jgi:hypothetical protein